MPDIIVIVLDIITTFKGSLRKIFLYFEQGSPSILSIMRQMSGVDLKKTDKIFRKTDKIFRKNDNVKKIFEANLFTLDSGSFVFKKS